MNIDFMQITSAAPELINVTWPPVFYQFLQFFDFVNADFLSITGASCVGEFNFISKYFFMSMLPIIGLGLGFFVYMSGKKDLAKKEEIRKKITVSTPNGLSGLKIMNIWKIRLKLLIVIAVVKLM